MIDTQAIRNKILDLAIRGKLTQQLPEDGDANVFLQQIQNEKEALLKEGKIKKNKIADTISDEEIPYEIPQNWIWVRFADICEIINGDRGKNYPAKSTLVDKGIPFISALNLDGKSVVSDARLLCMNENQYEKLGGGKLKKDDIVICIRGSLGKHGRYPFDKGAIASSLVISRIFYQKDVLGNYEMLWLDSSLFTSEIKKYDSGTAQPNLAAKDLEKFLFPLPPVREMKRIINITNELFKNLDFIDNLQKDYSNNLMVLKDKIIDAGIRGKLTEQLPEDGTVEELYQKIQEEKKEILSKRKGRVDKKIKEIDDDIPFDIPSNWKWIRFGEIGLFKKGPFGSALTKSMFVPKDKETVKVYEQQHAIRKDARLGKYYITKAYYEEKMRGFEVKPGDIIVSCAGTIGETFVMPEDIEKGIINQALMRITLVPSIDKKFFLYFFDSNLKKSAQNESNGVAITNIPPFDVLKNWYFPLVPIVEQKQIAEKIEELLSAIPE